MPASRTASLRTKRERDRLVEQFLPLVRYVVARLPVTMPASLDREDFFSVGVMGLMHAAVNYDPNRGASFKTFAYTAIRGAVLDEIRKHDPVPRNRRDRLRKMDRAVGVLHAKYNRPPTLEELAIHLEVSSDDLDDDLLALHTSKTLSLDDSTIIGQNSSITLANALVADDTRNPGDQAVLRDQVERMAQAISELPESDRHVIVLYHYENLYLKEIGEILGVSESRVSQILSRAIARLRLRMMRGEELPEER